MDNLVWVQELIEAPDLEALGTVLDAGLYAYVGNGIPADERPLAERCAFEHEVRRYLSRAQERGYAYQQRFPRMPSTWVDFVNQNKAAESEIARLNVRRAYESGRHEATEAVKEGWTAPATPPVSQAFDPVAMIDRLVQDAVAQRLPLLSAANVGSISPTSEPAASAATEATAESSSCRMSDVLVEFLKPLDRKRKHTAKGRGEAAPVIQFAVDFLGDPRMDELTEAKWKLLDEALPDIPNLSLIHI